MEENKQYIEEEEIKEQQEAETVLDSHEPETDPGVFQQTEPEASSASAPEPEAASWTEDPGSFLGMEDLGFLGGGADQLREVKAAITELNRCEQECKDTEKYLKAKTKELEIQKKRVEEKIAASIKKEKADLERGFDDEISTAEKAIKDAEVRKKNAKAAAVNERMKRENSSLVDDSKVLKAEIKSRFKEDGVPGICRNNLYYSLFCPKRFTDYLICIAAVLIFAGAIPFAVTLLVNGMVYKILVWALIVVFFAAIYFLISFWTKKGSRYEALNDMRSKVSQIHVNKKTIKSRNKNIRMDPDESQYNLYEYDQQLDSARTDLENAKAERQKALDHFENEDSVRIREEMQKEKAPVFEQMEKEIAVMQDDLRMKEDQYKAASQVMEGYNHELNDKVWKADKIDELINIIEEGRASTIREAMNVQKNK